MPSSLFGTVKLLRSVSAKMRRARQGDRQIRAAPVGRQAEKRRAARRRSQSGKHEGHDEGAVPFVQNGGSDRFDKRSAALRGCRLFPVLRGGFLLLRRFFRRLRAAFLRLPHGALLTVLRGGFPLLRRFFRRPRAAFLRLLRFTAGRAEAEPLLTEYIVIA